MVKDPTVKVKPWCPFCGQDVGRTAPPVKRKMDEFDVGNCQCGAIYVCDPTGHNIGSAMVEGLVYACDDNWDLAWDLHPEDDYLTGLIENYDEQTHRVVDTRNLDGRSVRGVLYFVRLNHDISQLVERLDKGPNKESTPSPSSLILPLEPVRDPKRKKKRTSKAEVQQCVDDENIDALVDCAFDDLRTLRFIQRLLYDPDEKKMWKTTHILGQVCARLSTRKPGAVSDLLHRLFESCTDSASSHWGLIEAIGSIIAARPDLYGALTRHLLMYRGVPSSRVQVLWALGTIAEHRPDLVRSTPFYSLFPYLNNQEPLTRGHAIRLFGRIKATEVQSQIADLVDNSSTITLYEQGKPVQKTLGELAQEALDTFLHEEEQVK